MKTLPELIACVRRELSLRIAVYPKRVREFKMKQEVADYEIECMREILAMLEKDSQQQELFTNEKSPATKPQKTEG